MPYLTQEELDSGRFDDYIKNERPKLHPEDHKLSWEYDSSYRKRFGNTPEEQAKYNPFKEQSVIKTDVVPERGIVGDVVSSLARGVSDAAKMGGYALKSLDPDGGINFGDTIGQGIIDASEKVDKWDFLKPDVSEASGEESYLKKSIMSGFRAVPLTAAAMGIGIITGPVLGLGAVAGGAISTLGFFGMGTYGQKYQEYINAGIPEAEAQKSAVYSGIVEGGFEALATYAGLKIFGADKLISQPLKQSVKELLSTPASVWAKRWAADTFLSEMPTEIIQNALGTQIDTSLGLQDEGAWVQAGIDAIIPTLVISTMFGAGTAGYTTVQKRQLKTDLNNMEDVGVRIKAVETIEQSILENEAKDEDGEITKNAEAWANMALDKIDASQEIVLSQDFVDYASQDEKTIAGLREAVVEDSFIDYGAKLQQRIKNISRFRKPTSRQRENLAKYQAELKTLLTDMEETYRASNEEQGQAKAKTQNQDSLDDLGRMGEPGRPTVSQPVIPNNQPSGMNPNNDIFDQEKANQIRSPEMPPLAPAQDNQGLVPPTGPVDTTVALGEEQYTDQGVPEIAAQDGRQSDINALQKQRQDQEIIATKQRVDDLESLDQSKMTRSEKARVQQQIKTSKQQLKGMGFEYKPPSTSTTSISPPIVDNETPKSEPQTDLSITDEPQSPLPAPVSDIDLKPETAELGTKPGPSRDQAGYSDYKTDHIKDETDRAIAKALPGSKYLDDMDMGHKNTFGVNKDFYDKILKKDQLEDSSTNKLIHVRGDNSPRTIESLIDDLKSKADWIKSSVGMIKTGGKAGRHPSASPTKIISAFSQSAKYSVALEEWKQKHPEGWKTYLERQKIVKKLEKGDSVIAPYGTRKNPNGSVYQIVRKNKITWTLTDPERPGSKLLVLPEALRPVEQTTSDITQIQTQKDADTKSEKSTLSLSDKGQQAHIDKQVEKLGSVEAVDKAYANDDKVSQYARAKAREVYPGDVVDPVKSKEKPLSGIKALEKEIKKKAEAARHLQGNKKGAWSRETDADKKRHAELTRLRNKLELLKTKVPSKDVKKPEAPVKPRVKIKGKLPANLLRKSAKGMQKTIDNKLNPASANQNPTPRRAQMAAGMVAEGERLQRIQKTMSTLADMYEDGTIPEKLAGLRTKAQVEMIDRQFSNRSKAKEKGYKWNPSLGILHKSHLNIIIAAAKGKKGVGSSRREAGNWVKYSQNDNVVAIDTPSKIKILEQLIKALGKGYSGYELTSARETLTEAKRYNSLGISSESELVDFLDEYGKVRAGEKVLTVQDKVKLKERKLLGAKIPGFFPTPKPVIDRMMEMAEIEPGMSALEPSAGKGDIADAIKDAGVNPDVIELSFTLNEILGMKGHNVVGHDFLDHTGEYDRIVMNPPFEKMQDIDHVKHAYSLLKPGGKLVAIMSEGPFSNSFKKAQAFRGWLEEVGGTSEKLGEGSFKGKDSFRQTGVNGRIVEIGKSVEQKAKPSEQVNPIDAVEDADLSKDVGGKRVLSYINERMGSRTQSDWDRLGKIYQEQLKSTKTEVNRMAKNDESFSIKEKIAISKATTFDELKGAVKQAMKPVKSKEKSVPKAITFQVSPDELDYQTAYDAHRNSSHTPEKRAKQEQQGFARHMKDIEENLLKSIDRVRPEDKAELLPILDGVLSRYKDGYLEKYTAFLQARSKTISPMITGPANFPTARNQKALDREQKVNQDLQSWEKWALKDAKKQLGLIKQPIYSDDPAAIEKLQDKLSKLEATHQQMKDINKIVRNKKLSDADKITAMVESGVSEKAAKLALEPDFAGRLGVPGYALTNNNANMKSIQKRIADLQSKSTDETTEIEFDGGLVVDNVEDNRVQIIYDDKPDTDVISSLKKRGFRWAPSTGAWQRKRTKPALYDAQNITGATGKTEQAPIEENKPKPIKKGLQGKKGTTYLNDNTPIEFQYEVMELSDVIPSHDSSGNPNPNFDSDLQPRDRSRKAMILQTDDMANKLNPEKLGDNPSIAHGAPMIANNSNMVEAGHGRTQAITKAYNGKTGAEYKTWLIDNATGFGVDSRSSALGESGSKIKDMDQPILVRRRITHVDNIKDITEKSNEPETAKMSATEQAVVDAGNLNSDDMLTFRPDGDGNINATSNQVFINRFLDKMGGNEKTGYVTSELKANKQLIDRIQAAIFHKAYGSDELLTMVAEDADPDIKNILNGLTKSANSFAKARGLDGNLAGQNIVNDIVDGINLLRKAKAENQDVKAGNGNSAITNQLHQSLSQGNMFDAGPSEASKEIANIIALNIRSGKRIGEFIDNIGVSLKTYLADLSQMEMFGTKQEISTLGLIAQSKKTLEDKYEEKQLDIFGQKPDTGTDQKDRSSNFGRGFQKGKPGVHPGRTETGKAEEKAKKNPQYSMTSTAPWKEDFPNVKTHTTVNKVAPNDKGEGGHPDHAAAKAGDHKAASRLVVDVVKPDIILELKKKYPNATVVPVWAQEATGVNMIPGAFAQAHNVIAGFKVNHRISQTNKTSHTKKNAAQRIISRAQFFGKVIKGMDYILVDDIVTTGETLSELKHYIENNGGNVVAVSTLGAAKGSTVLAMNPKTLARLKDKFNEKELRKAVREFNIVGELQALTESEAKYILKFRDVDSFRAKIIGEAEKQGSDEYGSVFKEAVQYQVGGQTQEESDTNKSVKSQKGKADIPAVSSFEADGGVDLSIIHGADRVFYEARDNGYTPPSPDNIPTFGITEDPTEFSKDNVIGYHWAEDTDLEDISERGGTLDKPGDLTEWGDPGNISTPGEGYIFTHRDIEEAISLLNAMERGAIYEVRGKAADRINKGAISWGGFDSIERVFPVDKEPSHNKIAEYNEDIEYDENDGRTEWLEGKPPSLLDLLRKKYPSPEKSSTPKIDVQNRTTTTPTKSNSPITPEKIKVYFKSRGLQTGTTPDGKLWVRTPRGLGFTVETVDRFSDEEYQIAINSGAMDRTGHIAGNLVGHDIKVSTEFGDKLTITHEIEHWLENAGLITPKEITMLNNNIIMRRGLAKNSKFKRQKDGRENRANYMSEILDNREQFRGTPLGNVLQKATDFIDALYQIARETMGKDRNSVRQVARGMETGSIYNRDGIVGQNMGEASPAYQAKRNTETPAFKKWFGKSKVVNEEGDPLVVYHGTPASGFDEFMFSENEGKNTLWTNTAGVVFFVSDPEIADVFSKPGVVGHTHYLEGKPSGIYPAYLNISNPYIVSAEEFSEQDAGGEYQDALDDAESDVESLLPDDLYGEFDSYLDIGADEETMPADFLDALQKYKDIYREGVEAFLKTTEEWNSFYNEIKQDGYDGIVIEADEDLASDKLEFGANNYVVFNPTQIKSTFNKGTWSQTDPRIQYSTTTPDPFSMDPDSTKFEDFKYHIVDVLNPVEKLYKAINKIIPEDSDFLLKERLRTSVAKDHIERSGKKYFGPIDKLIGENNLTVANVDEALYARHAPEANARLRLTNARYFLNKLAKAQKGGALKTKLKKLDAKFELEQFPTKEIQEGYLNTLEAELANAETDKELAVADKWNAFKEKPSGMTDDNASTLSEKWAGNQPMSEIFKIYDKMNAESLDISFNAGRMTEEEYKAIKGTFDYYAPLQREGFENKRQAGSGRGITNLGKDFMARGGSTKPAINLLANAIISHEKNIVRAEKAEVAKAFMNFVNENPNDEFWGVKQAKTKAEYDAHGNIRRRVDQTVNDNEVQIKVDGVSHLVYVNENNDHAMRMLDTIKGNDDNVGPIVNALSSFNRVLATVNTSLNPEFVFSNLIRDSQTAFFNISDTKVAEMKKQIFKDIPKALSALKSVRRGDSSHAWAETVKLYRSSGAQTGWMSYDKSIGTRVKKMEGQIDLFRPGHKTKKTISSVAKFVEDYNSIAENAVRLSAFKAGIDSGMTVSKAAIMAKGLTVNFTQKGASGQVINSLYLFANAGIQGSTRLITAIHKSPKVRKLVAGSVVAAVGLSIANMGIGGDDEDGVPYYEQIDDYIKSRNMIFMIPGGKGKYVKIPLPWGYNVFWALGTELGDAALSKNYDVLEGVSRMATTVADAFNPLQSSTILQMLSPTIGDPFVQVGENKTFFGSPLMPSNNSFIKPQKPDSERYWESARNPSKAFAKWLNIGTGGDSIKPGMVDISPETIDLVIDTFSGGAGRFFVDTLSLPFNLASGETNLRKTPVARRFLGERSEYMVSGDYAKNTEHIYQIQERLKVYPGKRKEIMGDKTYRLTGYMQKTEKIIRNLRKLEKVSKSKERKKAISDRIKQVKKRFNQEFLKYKQKE